MEVGAWLQISGPESRDSPEQYDSEFKHCLGCLLSLSKYHENLNVELVFKSCPGMGEHHAGQAVVVGLRVPCTQAPRTWRCVT